MTQKPEYVDLLNDIRLQEAGAAVYLQAWVDKTTDPGLKDCLSFVTARELSHGHIFARRIAELGYQAEGTEDGDFARRLQMLGSDDSDAEKIKAFVQDAAELPKPTLRDRYQAAVVDEMVDPLTRSLLRWWIDVEEDTRSLMGPVFDKVSGTSSEALFES